MALVIKNIYKSDAKPPGTSKIYYGPEMTFGAISATVVKNSGMSYYRNPLKLLRGPWWHFSFSVVSFFKLYGFYYGCSKSSLVPWSDLIVMNYLRWQLEVIIASCGMSYHWKVFDILRITVKI